MRRFILVGVLFLAFTGMSSAEMPTEGNTIRLSSSRSPWELVLPSQGLRLVQQKRTEDGSGSYYHYQGPSEGVNFSLFIEPADACRTAVECREMTWKRPNPAIKDPLDVTRFEENGFAVIRFLVPAYQGVKVNQLNLSAHAVRDGFWADIHLSKADAGKGDEALLRRILAAASFSKKAQSPQAVKPERRFGLPDHGVVLMTAPTTWIDKVRQPPDLLPPTIVFMPELGNAFRVMITPIWPAKKGTPQPPDSKIREHVERSLAEVRGSAVESSIPLRELKRGEVRGYFYSVTDRNPKPGEFKYLTQGTVATGELTITFTVLSNDSSGRTAEDALTMIGSIRHVP